MYKNEIKVYEILGDAPTYNEYGEAIAGETVGTIKISLFNVACGTSPLTPVSDGKTYYAWAYGPLKIGQRITDGHEEFLVKTVNDKARHATLCELVKTR